jgi:hypothetical protein
VEKTERTKGQIPELMSELRPVLGRIEDEWFIKTEQERVRYSAGSSNTGASQTSRPTVSDESGNQHVASRFEALEYF